MRLTVIQLMISLIIALEKDPAALKSFNALETGLICRIKNEKPESPVVASSAPASNAVSIATTPSTGPATTAGKPTPGPLAKAPVPVVNKVKAPAKPAGSAFFGKLAQTTIAKTPVQSKPIPLKKYIPSDI
jgi:hypothetical protein